MKRVTIQGMVKIAILAMVSCGATMAHAESYSPLQEKFIEKGWKGDIIWRGEHKGERVVLSPSFDVNKKGQSNMVLHFKGFGKHCIDEMVEKNKSPDGRTMYMLPSDTNTCKGVEKVSLIALDARQLRVEVSVNDEVIASGNMWPHNGHAGLKMYAPVASRGVKPRLSASPQVSRSEKPVVKSDDNGFGFGAPVGSSDSQKIQQNLSAWGKSSHTSQRHKMESKKTTKTVVHKKSPVPASGFGFTTVSKSVAPNQANNALASWGEKGKVASQPTKSSYHTTQAPAAPSSLNEFYMISESGNVQYITGNNSNLVIYSTLPNQAIRDQGVRSGELIGKMTYSPRDRRLYTWEKLKMEPQIAKKYRHCGPVYSSRSKLYVKAIRLPNGSYAANQWKVYPAEKRGTCVYPITSRESCNVVRCNKYEYGEAVITKDREFAMRLGRENQANSTGKSYAEKKREADQLEGEGQRKAAAKNLEFMMKLFQRMGQGR